MIRVTKSILSKVKNSLPFVFGVSDHKTELQKTQVALTQYREACSQLKTSIERNGFAKAIILEEVADSATASVVERSGYARS